MEGEGSMSNVAKVGAEHRLEMKDKVKVSIG